MRPLLLASAGLLALSGGALAQTSPGEGSPNTPLSNRASNINEATRHSNIAPRLPISHADATVDEFLNSARSSVRAGRTGAAQESLERAETRLLSRSTPASEASTPDSSMRVQHIREARQALGRRDRRGAEQAIEAALAMPDQATGASAAPVGSPAPPNASPGMQPIGSTGQVISGATTNTHPAGGSGSNSSTGANFSTGNTDITSPGNAGSGGVTAHAPGGATGGNEQGN